jgi:hypothetical protein
MVMKVGIRSGSCKAQLFKSKSQKGRSSKEKGKDIEWCQPTRVLGNERNSKDLESRGVEEEISERLSERLPLEHYIGAEGATLSGIENFLGKRLKNGKKRLWKERLLKN